MHPNLSGAEMDKKKASDARGRDMIVFILFTSAGFGMKVPSPSKKYDLCLLSVLLITPDSVKTSYKKESRENLISAPQKI